MRIDYPQRRGGILTQYTPVPMSVHVEEADMETHVRAGLTMLGQYRSRGRYNKLRVVLDNLARSVVVPAIDRPLHDRLVELGYRLDAERDNKSVTQEQWIWRAIERYACPVHNQAGSSPNIPGELCCCGSGRGRGGANSAPTTGGLDSTLLGTTDATRGGREVGPGRDQGCDATRIIGGGVHIDDRGSSLPGTSGTDRCQPGRRGVFGSGAYRLAIASVRSALGSIKGRLKPLAVDEVVENHIHRDSYSSLPYLASNELVLRQGTRDAIRIGCLERGFDPYLYGRRVSPGDVGPKTRLIWMAPLSSTIVASTFSVPVQQALARVRPFTWGHRQAERGAIIGEFRSRFRYTYAIDYSKFDASVPAQVISEMFRLVRSKLELSDREDKVFWAYVHDFIHSRMVMPDMRIIQKHRGVPSGSAFTSLIGSMVNLLVTNYCWIRATGHPVSHEQILVMGDDSIIGTTEYVDPTHLARAAAELGFTLNPSKCQVLDNCAETKKLSDHPHFLGYFWVHGTPRRPKEEVAKLAAFPEKHKPYSERRSMERLGGYAMTCVEGYHLLLEMFPSNCINDSIFAYQWKLSNATGESLSPKDYPSELRVRAYSPGVDAIEVNGSYYAILDARWY